MDQYILIVRRTGWFGTQKEWFFGPFSCVETAITHATRKDVLRLGAAQIVKLLPSEVTRDDTTKDSPFESIENEKEIVN